MYESDFALAASLPPTLAKRWYRSIEQTMMEFAIVSPIRAAMFIATLGHESHGFRFTREIWGPTVAQMRYECRRDLGNICAGDGYRYRGRGLIHITGRANYEALSTGLGIDYARYPEWLEQPEHAARGSGWWWFRNGCNALADKGDFLALSIRVNGKNANGLPNGWKDRQHRFTKACHAFGVA
jgi:putative chitinase